MLKIETIRDDARFAALAPEWECLDARLSPRRPFTSPLWCRLWWEHFRRDDLQASDHLRLYVVRDETGALVAVAPMFVTHRPGRGLIRTRELQFFGADPYVTEMRGPICQRGDGEAIFNALRAHIDAEGECDWVQWRGVTIPDDQPLPNRFQPESNLDTVDYFLSMPASWDEFKSGLSRNIKESLRKCYNSLSRENHSFELRVVDSPEAAPAAVNTFFALHRMRASASETVEHGDVFESERSRAFLSAYCQALADRGALRLFQLVIEGRVVATRVGFALGDELYLYFSGYDLEWARFSVMTTTVAEVIKWAIEKKYRIVNLSTGSDVSKTRWRPENVSFRGGYTVSANPMSRLAFGLVSMLRNKSHLRKQLRDVRASAIANPLAQSRLGRVLGRYSPAKPGAVG